VTDPCPDPTPTLIDALRLIDRTGCEKLTRGRCADPDSGFTRGAPAGADAWCLPCVAYDALRATGVLTDGAHR
jgi:hypothetical protein